MIRHLQLFALTLALASAAWAQPKDDADLPFREDPTSGEKVPLFMHSTTFIDSSLSSGWGRDAVEIEAATTLTGVEGKELFKLLQARDMRAFKRLRRSEAVEAFSLGFDVNEIPWTSDAEAVREGFVPGDRSPTVTPYVWLTIESDKFPVDPERNRRRLELGTDVMDDIYYDNDQFLLLDNDLSVRARKRWDSVDVMRRLLIAMKKEGGVDEFGIKRAAKMDQRSDSPSNQAIRTLHEAVTRGQVSWGGRSSALEKVYNDLRERGLLSSTQSYQDVLILEPKAFLRSVRSRYHLNEISDRQLRSTHELGLQRVTALLAMAREARQDGAVPADRLAEVQAFEARAQGLLDGSSIAEFARAPLAKLGVTADVAEIQSLLPTSPGIGRSTGLADVAEREVFLLQRKAVAEATRAAFAQLNELLDNGDSDSLRRVITRTLERTDLDEDSVEWFTQWARSEDASLGPQRTLERFVALHEGMLGDAAALQRYNAYGQAQRASGDNDFEDFEPLDQAAWDGLRFHLRNEQVRIWNRQLKTAGTVALGMWFDEARAFYVPDSRRSTGNFLIDTMDFASIYEPTVFAGVAPQDQTAAVDLSRKPYVDKLMHATLVNEVQIELDYSSQYTDRLKELASVVELPRQFMRWASASGLADDEAAYAALYAELRALGDDELQARLIPFNDHLAKVGSPVQNLAADEFTRWLDTSRLTLEVRDDASYTVEGLQPAIAGARFVFEQYREMLTFVAKLKEERVKDTLDRAGADEDALDWVPSTGSKGSIAVSMIRDSGVNTGGLIDWLTPPEPNNSVATAEGVGPGWHKYTLTSGEDDYFRIIVDQGQTLDLSVSGQGPVDLTLEVLSEDGATQLVAPATSASYTATDDTVVIVKVTASGTPNDGAYTFRVSKNQP
ncbi:MAG: hypothetical protein KDD82_14380 [Planctomycetes bacterium]|nr:hypothetical protein [Planctomycetota bacterium]